MPLYLYRCENGHESEHLVKAEFRDDPHPCLVCGGFAGRVLHAPNLPPDGTYSYNEKRGE